MARRRSEPKDDDAMAAASQITYLTLLAAICAGMLLLLSFVLVTRTVPFVLAL